MGLLIGCGRYILLMLSAGVVGVNSNVPTTFAICTFTLAWALAQLTALKPERQRFFSSLLTEVNTLLDGGIGKPPS